MEPLLLGLATPSIASTAGAVGRVVTPVAKFLASPFAALLHEESQPVSTAEPKPAELPTIKLEDLKTRAEELQEDLESRIQLAIKDSGAQLDFPVRLRISVFDGTLEADGVASPQREILEAALASDPSLADDFRQLVALQQLLSAAEKHARFAEVYARDPQEAIAAYTSRGDDRFEALLHLAEADNQLRLEFE